jgi:hypothetical protein
MSIEAAARQAREALADLVARVEVEASYRGWGEWGAMTGARSAIAALDAALSRPQAASEREAFDARFPGCAFKAKPEWVEDCCNAGWEAWQARAALDAALAATPKPLDDPRLQGLFSDAISGALAFGAQNTNPPPAGHWLERFWQMGRAERELSEAAPAAGPVALTDEVLRYAMAAMGTGSPMDAEKFRLFWRYAHDAAMGQLK